MTLKETIIQAKYKDILEINKSLPFEDLLAMSNIKIFKKDFSDVKLIKNAFKNNEILSYDYFYLIAFDSNNMKLQDAFQNKVHAKKLFYTIFGEPHFRVPFKYNSDCWIIDYKNTYYLCYTDRHSARPSISLLVTSESFNNAHLKNKNLTNEEELFNTTFNNDSDEKYQKLKENSEKLKDLIFLNKTLSNFFEDYNVNTLYALKKAKEEENLISNEIKTVVKKNHNKI